MDGFEYKTISDVKVANASIGHHWFDRDTMRFFRSRIEAGLYGGRYFVTSEQQDDDSPRLYTIREALPDGRVETVGEFQGYRTRDAAIAEAKALARGG